jgi:hypothetical protein
MFDNWRNNGHILIPGLNNGYASATSLNHNLAIIGNGIYCTPHINDALVYANILNINGKGYFLIFQCRVNQKMTHIPSTQQSYWVVNNSKDIRPYGIILVK